MNKSVPMKFLTKYRVELMGLAMIWIVLYHSQINFSMITYPIGNIISKIISIGYAGADIFFLLSGLGLSFSLTKDSNIKNFYKKRFARIIPTFWLVVVMTHIKNIILGDFKFADLFFSLFGLDFVIFGNLYIWFVPAILICYLFFPVYYFLSEEYGFLKIFVFSSVFTLILSLIISNSPLQHLLIFTIRLPVFFFGAYIGRLLVNGKSINLLNNIWFSIITFLISVFFVIFISAISTDEQGWSVGLWWYPTIFMAYPLSLLLGYGISKVENNFPKLLNLIRPFGLYSLEFFTLHRFLFSIANDLPLNNLNFNYLRIPEFLFYILVTLLASAIVFKFSVTIIKKLSAIGEYLTVSSKNADNIVRRQRGE